MFSPTGAVRGSSRVPESRGQGWRPVPAMPRRDIAAWKARRRSRASFPRGGGFVTPSEFSNPLRCSSPLLPAAGLNAGTFGSRCAPAHHIPDGSADCSAPNPTYPHQWRCTLVLPLHRTQPLRWEATGEEPKCFRQSDDCRAREPSFLRWSLWPCSSCRRSRLPTAALCRHRRTATRSAYMSSCITTYPWIERSA
jgi:hypothetical protein